LDEQYLIRIFANGLREVIRAELKLYKTKNLSEIVNKAHNIEVKNIVVAKAAGDY